MKYLSDIAEYVSEKILSNRISINEYVTTDSLLPNKEGRTIALNLPPQTCNLTLFRQGDVLIANIRPYLRKIWLANFTGGCSADVLVLRAKDIQNTGFLYAVLMQDDFFNYVMKGAKGSKMPRGDKEQIMRYRIPTFSALEAEKVGNLVLSYNKKIALNRAINHNLEAMAKQLYDYWFVQFDFPNKEGKPYKSSGGAMEWNKQLKREIPVGWFTKNICKIAKILSGGTPSKAVDDYWNGSIPFFGPTDYDGSIFQMDTAEHITENGLSHCASSKFDEGTVIITARGSVGKLVIVGTPMAMNQSCYALESIKKEYEYLYYLTKQLIEYLKVKRSGSVFKSIITQDIETSILCIAPEDIVTKYCDRVRAMFLQIKKNSEEIQTLINQRDDLLPLLMNGQVQLRS